MIYGSVCSGIESVSVAWESLGWRSAFLSEIAPFPRAVLSHRFPDTPLHGDFSTIQKGEYESIDLLVGGTPCQSFSLAGLRGGLVDERGNLALEFCRLLTRLEPRVFVWENVPGVMSSDGGRDFGTIIGAFLECGYGVSWRILDAKFFRMPQRRRRVFVVGYLRDPGLRAAEILFDSGGNCGHSHTSEQTRPTVSAFTANGIGVGGPDAAHVLAGHYFPDGDGVRRFTPREVERLFGFPDDWTLVPYKGKPAPDLQRYKALGNSMSVDVMRWLGRRIAMVERKYGEGA